MELPQPVSSFTDTNKSENNKKRKRSNKRKQAASSRPATKTPPPTSTLIIDNGGHTIKYGWASQESPQRMPNQTAKLLHQWTVLVGDELQTIRPHQIESTTRSTERGIITNWSCQIQVWKRLLENMGIVVPMTSEAAQTFGWKTARSSTSSQQAPEILPHACAVLILLPPLCPRTILEQCMNVWFQEFHFGHVGFAISPVMACASPYSCMVDASWSSVNIVPTFQQAAISQQAIRRVTIGGRHLIQLWKYQTSYRQWNLMDQEGLLTSILQQLGFVSLDFDEEMNVAQRLPLGQRPFDREFVLPDYSTTYKGYVRMPAALQRQQATLQEAAEASETSTRQEEEEGEGGTTNEKGATDENVDTNDSQGEDEQQQQDEDDDDEESDEAKRQRLLRQRKEEERRRQELEAERQVLMVSVERFTIPEVLFRPTDAGLAPNLAGLPQAIIASIAACPREYQAAMYQSIRIVGGLAQLSNLQERLEREVRSLAPCQYDVCVQVVDSPVEQAWLGAKKWVEQKPYTEWSVAMDEWEASRKDSRKPKAWHRLLAENGGAVV